MQQKPKNSPKINLIFISLSLVLFSFREVASVSSDGKLPLVINTWAFEEANAAAWEVLNHEPGGNALDALVEGCSTCERLQCDGTVGYGGSPDENGETTLDAMVMDGSNMNIGAVAGMREIKDAARVARFVLEHTRHTMLVGSAASDFAEMMGFRRESLTTATSKAIWQEWQQQKSCQPNFWVNVYPDASQHCGPYKPLSQRRLSKEHMDDRARYKIDRWNHDTIGMIVINEEKHIYAGTSTNGARHKIPGRVGDSPIPGAGAYADNEVGAAVATGDGDIMMRFLPALVAVEALRNGRTPEQSAKYAMQRIVRYHEDFSGALVVVDRFGNYSAACVGIARFPFSVVNGASTQRTRVEHKDCQPVVDFY